MSFDIRALFDENYYISRNPDVANALARGAIDSGLTHFLLWGQYERRRPSEVYDEQFYLANNPDVAAAVSNGSLRNGLQHFLEFGRLEGRSPSSAYNEQFYLSHNPDVASAVAQGRLSSGLQHFLAMGRAEGRVGTASNFTIQFDYRFDTTGFFADPARRVVLEAAADVWEALIEDEFVNVAAGTEFSVLNPQTGQRSQVVLNAEVDDLIVFVGAQSPPFGTATGALAAATPDGVDVAGSVFRARYSGSNFEPWAGSISFNSTPTFADSTPSSWFFDATLSTSNDIPRNAIDFFSTALHELGHILGVGTAPIFREIGAGALADGPNAKAANGGAAIPLSPDLAHVADGFLSDGRAVLFGEDYPGDRQGVTRADLALLADIGYQIAGYQSQGSTPPIATAGNDLIFGTVAADVIQGLAGNDQIQGDAGNDFLRGNEGDDVIFGQGGHDTLIGDVGNDQLVGGEGNDFLNGGVGNDTLFGGAGRDTFFVGPANGQDAIADFMTAEDTIEVAASLGFSTGPSLLNAIVDRGSTSSGSLFSVVALSPGNSVTIFHTAPLTSANFVVV